MVRGVNKTVIEIASTDSGYFERAILFVNPEQSHISQKRLQAEAQKYVSIIEADMKNIETSPRGAAKNSKLRRFRIRAVIMLCSVLTAAAGLLFLIFNSL